MNFFANKIAKVTNKMEKVMGDVKKNVDKVVDKVVDNVQAGIKGKSILNEKEFMDFLKQLSITPPEKHLLQLSVLCTKHCFKVSDGVIILKYIHPKDQYNAALLMLDSISDNKNLMILVNAVSNDIDRVALIRTLEDKGLIKKDLHVEMRERYDTIPCSSVEVVIHNNANNNVCYENYWDYSNSNYGFIYYQNNWA
jgi:hypothetical protein